MKPDEKSRNLEKKNDLHIKENKDIMNIINKEKYLYSNSDSVFDNVSSFYFLNGNSHKDISSISSKFLLSSFTLEYLHLLNDLIVKKFDIPQLTLNDFESNEKITVVMETISNLDDEPVLDWVKNECLPELCNIINNLDIKDIDKLNKVGHIIKLTLNEMKFDNNFQDIELYDLLYRFKDRLDDFEIDKNKKKVILEYHGINESDDKMTVNIFEVNLPKKPTKIKIIIRD
ncbi:MAG: hypothetical protein K8S14_06585 [Actinomycetia bacterium]|nr:hypothetical protein [Actinomycetes bacterium]